MKSKYMRMRDELLPIPVPPEPGWTTEQDEEFVEHRLGDDYEGLDEILVRAFDSLRDLSTCLRRALTCSGAKVDHHVDHNVSQLIDLVDKQLQSCLSPEKYGEYFAEHIAICRFVDAEFNRLLHVYTANRDLVWMAPWADLGDWIISANIWLEDGIASEFPDFEKDEGVGLSKEVSPRSAVQTRSRKWPAADPTRLRVARGASVRIRPPNL